MDNPNDFIHIDEVFRRMKGREEPEPAGAWMRMKDLLDKEMPVAAPAVAGSSLRRYMIPLAALLLLGSGAAWYSLKGSKTDADRPAAVSVNSGVATPAGDPGRSVSVKDATAFADKTSRTGNSTAPSGAAQHVSGGHTTSDGLHETPAAGGRAKNSTGETGNKATHKAVGSNANPGNQPGTGMASVAPAHTSGNSNGQKHRAKGAAVATGGTQQRSHTAPETQDVLSGGALAGRTTQPAVAAKDAAAKSSSASASRPSAKPARSFEEQHILEDLYPSSASASKPGAGTPGGHLPAPAGNNVPGMKVVASSWNDNKIVKDELSGGYYKEVRDTFKKIEMVERLAVKNENNEKNTGLTKVTDTLTITRVERVRFVPLEPVEIAALRKAKIIPMAHPAVIPAGKVKEYTVANEMVNLVPLANYKVASRRMDPSKFNQIVQSTTQGISNYFDGTNKFYAAILLGGNAFIGNPGAFGMQFGIAGLYQLNERLTLGAEIKFSNHYFSNYTINDQSVSYGNISSQQVSGVEWLFNGTKTTTTSAYRVNSFSALEFPVTLSYSLGRVSVFGGASLTYAFPVKWEKTNTMSMQDVSGTNNEDKNPFVASGPTMNEQQDFASRMGLGYVAGLSYDVSRKVSLDARMTQNLWTSYNGNAKAVNDLFKTPTFQFSISYFFGRKERVVYIMDRK